MAYCDSCNNLQDYASSFLLNGIRDKECNSLAENTGLNPDLEIPHENCEDLKDMADCLLGSLIEKLPAYDECTLKEFVAQLTPNVYNVVYALVCSTCGLWTKLEILEEIVNSLLRQQYKQLRPNVDYECKLYSGFTVPDAQTGNPYVSVGVIETENTMVVQAYSSPSRNTVLRHPQIRNGSTLNVMQRHTQALADRLTSRMFAFRFLGDYAKYNSNTDYEYVNNMQPTSGNWNLLNQLNYAGSAFGGTFQATQYLENYYLDEDNERWRVMTGLSGYSDGWNTQFNASIYPTTISSDHINHQLDFTLIRNE